MKFRTLYTCGAKDIMRYRQVPLRSDYADYVVFSTIKKFKMSRSNEFFSDTCKAYISLHDLAADYDSFYSRRPPVLRTTSTIEGLSDSVNS